MTSFLTNGASTLKKDLERHGITADFLKKAKACVAGGLVVQSLLEQNWPNSDIDIWVEHSGLQSAGSILDALGVGADANASYGFPTCFTNKHLPTQYARLYKYIKYGMSFRPNRSGLRRIQVIFLKPNITHKQLVQSFDLEFTHFYYCPVENANAIIEVSPNASALLRNKTITFSKVALELQTIWEWIRTLKRVLKYANRGFTGEMKSAIEKAATVVAKKAQDNRGGLQPISQAINIWNRNVLFLTYFFDGGNVFIDPESYNVVSDRPAEFEGLDVGALLQIITNPRRGTPQNLNIGVDEDEGMAYLQEAIELMPWMQRDLPQLNANHAPPSMPATARDIIMMEDLLVDEHLNESPQNIVIVEERGNSALCTTRDVLRNFVSDQTHVFFPCSANGFPVDETKPLVKLTLPNATVFVPSNDINDVGRRNAGNTFYVAPTSLVFQRTASMAATDGARNGWVGRDHCQEGSDKRVYRLVSYHGQQGGKRKQAEKKLEKKPKNKGAKKTEKKADKKTKKKVEKKSAKKTEKTAAKKTK